MKKCIYKSMYFGYVILVTWLIFNLLRPISKIQDLLINHNEILGSIASIIFVLSALIGLLAFFVTRSVEYEKTDTRIKYLLSSFMEEYDKQKDKKAIYGIDKAKDEIQLDDVLEIVKNDEIMKNLPNRARNGYNLVNDIIDKLDYKNLLIVFHILSKVMIVPAFFSYLYKCCVRRKRRAIS